MKPLEDMEVLSLALRGGKYRVVTEQIRGGAKSHLVEKHLLFRNGELDEWSTSMEPYSTPIYSENGRRFCYTPFPVDLSQDDVQLWSADGREVAERIRSLLGCRGPSMEELVPRKLWRLGPTPLAIGRRTGRNVFFLTAVTPDDRSALEHLPATGSDFVVIIGHLFQVDLDDRMKRLSFRMEDAFEIDGEGGWSVIGDAFDIHFGKPEKPEKDRNAAEREGKALDIAGFFMSECFHYLHRWDELLVRRKALAKQTIVAKFTNLTDSDVSRIIGKDALRRELFPVAAFWRRTFLEQDSYRIFEEWVEGDEDAKMAMKPDQLRTDILRYTTQRLLKEEKRKKE